MSDPIKDMTSSRMRQIAHKLGTYVRVYDGDKEARAMIAELADTAELLDAEAERAKLVDAVMYASGYPECGFGRIGARNLIERLHEDGYQIVKVQR